MTEMLTGLYLVGRRIPDYIESSDNYVIAVAVPMWISAVTLVFGGTTEFLLGCCCMLGWIERLTNDRREGRNDDW